MHGENEKDPNVYDLDDLPLDPQDDAESEGIDPLDPEQSRFRPPDIPTLVHCLHCHRDYESYLIEWRVESGGTCGHWCCPTPGCDGLGYGFDILPVDPEFGYDCDEDEGDDADVCDDHDIYDIADPPCDDEDKHQGGGWMHAPPPEHDAADAPPDIPLALDDEDDVIDFGGRLGASDGWDVT